MSLNVNPITVIRLDLESPYTLFPQNIFIGHPTTKVQPLQKRLLLFYISLGTDLNLFNADLKNIYFL